MYEFEIRNGTPMDQAYLLGGIDPALADFMKAEYGRIVSLRAKKRKTGTRILRFS